MSTRFSTDLRRRVHRLPRWLRITIGMSLLIGGVLGFLPVLGFWMIPLGLFVLSREFHWARRAHAGTLRLISRYRRWRRRRRG